MSSVTTPERKLCAFARLSAILPGERRRVSISVEADTMALIDASGVRVMEPGRFELEIGNRVTEFEVR